MTSLTAHPRMLFSAVTILQHTHTIFLTHREDTPLSSTTRGLQHLAPDRVRAAESANTLQPRRGGGGVKDVYSASGRRYRRRRLSPPLCFPSPPAKLQLPRLDLGPRPHVRVSCTEITERFAGAASPPPLRFAIFHISASLHARVNYIPLTWRSAQT